LNSPSPRDTIHHMKKGESTSDLSKAERLHYMIKIIINTLEKIPGLVSGNIVGSTADKNTKRYPGDIDVVIIVKKLDKRTFHDIISLFRSREELFRDYTGIRLNINTLFGPIKFHKEGAITIHLMIYDLNAHIEHVLKSPFTCLDWEKTRIFVGKHIRDVFQTPDLMPRDFIDSRRSIHEHTKALSEGKITYREYQFDNEGLAEQRTHKKEMNGQDKFEYSYHIMLFTMLNFLKLYDAENVNLPEKEIMTRYFSIIDANRHKYIKFFRRLKNMKKSGKFSVWKDRYVQIVRQFFEDFQAEYDEIFGMSAKKIILLRHIETPSNDEDVFIGQKQDPSIKMSGYEKHRQVSENLNEFEFTNVYSSPMTRCKQTLQALGFESYKLVDDLKEIDYGEAEGKTLDDLHKEFPEIIDGWRHSDDPAFPSGENTDDVKTRAFRFLHNINKEKGDTLICTHNVPIRTIVGSLLGLPMHDWYLLNIPFAEPIELLIAKNGKYYLNLSLNMKEVLFENLKRKTIRNCIGTGEATIRRDKQM
ncbi:MAG: histidine phosphatase family protein, partial [Candidatus Woesearchaeota archaeon]